MAQHNELGKKGEQVAARHLMQNGYSIRHTDYRVGHKDIDIVAFKDGTTVFVEVKSRSSDFFGEPEEAVDNAKIRNLISAANAYMARHKVDGRVRFDVITVVGTEEPYKVVHFENAFEPLGVSPYRGGGAFAKYNM